MELDMQELVLQEVQKQVKDKINGKLHLQVQKELKEYKYVHMISNYVNDGLKQLLNETSLLYLIDREKLQKDVTNIVSRELLNRMTTSFHEEDYDDYYR